MVSGKEFWNKRAQVYDQQVSGIYQEAYEKTAAYSLAQLHPEDRVLEFACGTGIVTCAVAPHVEHVLAIDQAEEMAGKAWEKADPLFAGLCSQKGRQSRAEKSGRPDPMWCFGRSWAVRVAGGGLCFILVKPRG